MSNCINKNHPDVAKLAGELNILPAVAAAKIGVWQSKNNIFDRFPTKDELNKKEEVNYNLKAVDILSSDKAKQVFDKGQKNKWSLDKILTELQIPKEQKQLILSLGKIELTSEQSNTILLNKKDLSENESDNNESIFNEKIVENTSTVNNYFNTNKKLLFGNENTNKSFTAQDVLNNIIESDITLSKAGTELVLKAMSLLKNANTRVKVISQERFDQLTKDTQGDGVAVMAYNYDLGNNIYITEKSLRMFKPELIIESFIHEVAHNISIKALINPETYQEKEFHDFIKKAFEQYKFLAKKLNDAKSYGFTNEKEFVAEIYSNAQFREELQQIDKSFWRKFIDEIRRLFGLPKSLQNDNLIDSILLLETVDNFINTNTNVPSILFKNDYSKSFSNTDFKIVKEAETYDLTTIDKKVEHLVNQAKSKVAELINRTKKSTKEKAQEFLEEYKKLEKELDEVSTISQWKAVTSYMVSFQTTINKLQKSLNDRFKIQEVTYNNVIYTKVKNAEVFKSENGDYITPEDFKDKIQKEFFESKPFIVDSELYNNIENEGIKQLSTKDFTELAVNYENYLASYDLLEDVKKLLSDTVKDATLSREDKLEIKNLNNKLNEIIEPHDKLIAQLKKIKKESFIKLLADSSNNKKVINKWKNKLAIEYKKLVNPKESEVEWIGYQMNNIYAEQIQKDLLEEAEKIVNNPYIDITKFSKNWVDLLNINSPLISIMSNIVGKMRDKIITEISEIGFTFDKYFKDYSKFNDSISMSSKYGNLIELNDSDDTYYLKGKYSIKFKESFNKLVSKLIEDNKNIENYDYKKDKLYKNWIAENTKSDGFGNKIPQDKWLNKDLTKEELKVLNFFIKLTKENDKTIYNGKGGLSSTFFGAEYYKLPSKTKSNKERTFEGDIKGQLKDAVSDLTETKVDDINYGQAFDSKGEELRRIKINFRGKLDSKDQSLDLFSVYRAEQSNAISYKYRSKNETKLKLFLDIAKDKQYKRKSLLDGKWAKNIFAKEEVKGQLFSGEFSNEVEKIKGILETALYDVTSYDEQKLLGKLDANKLTSKVNGIAATIGMTLNIGSSTVNFLNGEMMMSMLRIGGKYTNKANQTKAHANYFANLHNILADISNPVKKSFHNQMLNMFDVIGGHNINKQDFLNNSAVKEILSSHNLNFTNESVEHMLNSILTESILRSILVLNTDYKYIDKEGNITTKENAASLFDMLYLNEDGILKTKNLFKYTEYNLIDDYHNNGKQSLNYLIKKKVHDLYGVYDNNMKAEVAKHWYGKLVLMFKNFFMSQAIYRYKGMTTANKSKDELDDEDLDFNNAEQEFTEGIYTTVVRTFFPLLKGFNIAMVKENFNNLTDYEKSNLKQAFFEIGLTAVLLPLLGAILASSAGGDDDDDLYFYLFVFRRLESELSQFRNLPELNRMITNPVAANRFLQNGFTVIEDIMTPINFTPKNNESYFDWLSEDTKENNTLLKHAFTLAPGRSLFMNTYKQRFTLMNR